MNLYIILFFGSFSILSLQAMNTKPLIAAADAAYSVGSFLLAKTTHKMEKAFNPKRYALNEDNNALYKKIRKQTSENSLETCLNDSNYRLLLKRATDRSYATQTTLPTALQEALEGGDFDTVKLLIETNADAIPPFWAPIIQKALAEANVKLEKGSNTLNSLVTLTDAWNSSHVRDDHPQE